MPLNTNLNINPYNDDFNANTNYTRILFNPSRAIQARELTQIQTILQNQIEQFGNWAFKNGDIVSGCSISTIPNLSFVRIQDYQNSNNAFFNIASLVNTQVVSSSSNLQARVVTSLSGISANYPNTNMVYLQYLNTGIGGQQVFSNNETLTFYTIPRTGNNTLDTVAVINTYSNTTANTYSTGNAHGISVSDGIVFLSGAFVKVLTPTIGLVNAYGNYAGNNVVGFQSIETIVTENQDTSLLDNSLGYSNENAPGAHRIKITPTLISLDSATAANTVGFNPIAVYNFGSLISTSNAGSNVYSIVNDAISQRIYDEAGNYVVNPFSVDTVTSISGNSIISSLSSNNVLGRINPGVGYALGNRVEIQKTSYINMRRGVDTQVNTQQQISFNYGGYFILNEVAGTFEFDQAQTVTFYDSYQKSVTNRTFASTSPTGNNIGTASVRCFSYSYGIPGSNTAQYLLHVFNVRMSSNYNSSSIKSVYYNGTKKGIADVFSNGQIASSFNDQLYSFGTSGLKNLRNASNSNNTEYVYRKKTSTSMYSNGVIVVTIPASATGGVDILPYGTGILSDLNSSKFVVITTANATSAALTGTVSVNTTSTNVVGTSTTFNSNYTAYDQIQVGSDIRTILSITNNTFLTVDSTFSVTNAAASYYKAYQAGRILPVLQSLGTGSISVSNTTSFTINTTQVPSSTVSVDVIYDILRTNVSPAQKTINKNRFVKILANNNVNGPWCLGLGDVHKLTKVYSSTNGSYTTSGSDVTSNFIFDSGQRDTYYDLGYLYPKPGYTVTSNTSLLVQLDYFSVNTASGSGFFSVESYPIDDANTANTNAITTINIPLYVDSTGSKTNLRDYIDFRTPITSTANDTGTVDTSNSTQVTTAISYATINPSSNVAFNSPGSGLNIPSYGQNFQADYTFYLPRKDLVMITPDNVIKVKEGVSSLSPQSPLFPDSVMPITILNIPAYPSLSSDQVDQLLAINQSSKTLCRDTSSAISSSLVTNRRYTMKDIGKLDQRITNLEYYTQLTLLEKKAADMTITDSNGLNRFKNGIFVDSFNDFTQSDVSNPEYSIAIDSKKGLARPRIIREVVKIKFNANTSTNVQKTGRVVSLPYTESTFISQPYATKYRSAAHVAYSWNGTIVLIPSYDNHNDITNTGSINITVDNTTAWKDFAQSPMGSIWGDWKTTTNTVVTSVVTGTPTTSTVNLGYLGWIPSVPGAYNSAIGRIQAAYGSNIIIGNLSISHTSNPIGTWSWNNVVA